MSKWEIGVSYEGYETFLGIMELLQGYTLQLRVFDEPEPFNVLLMDVTRKEDDQGVWCRRKRTAGTFCELEFFPVMRIHQVYVY